MNESILDTIRKMLGYEADVTTPFDIEIIQHINAAFSILTQLGLGPKSGFSIKDNTSVWSDIIPEGVNLEDVKMYIYLKTRIVFDPPASSSALETMKEQIKEYEFRINIEVDEG